jgi:hypothetical protein
MENLPQKAASIAEYPDAEPTTLDSIRMALTDDRVSVDKLAGLMGLQERAEARNAEREFYADMASALAEMPTINKNATKDMGQKGSIPYATYDLLDKTIRPIERKWGFSRIFVTAPLDKPGTLMTLKLLHRGGHHIDSTRYMAPDPGPGRNETQAIGSADSYARRYLTLAVWNLITVGADDDADATGRMTEKHRDHIQTMLDACEIKATSDEMVAFLKFAGVEKFDDMWERDYARLLAALKKRKEKSR